MDGSPPAPRPADPARLAGLLKALASPVRLELLQALQAPRTLSEIRLAPRRRGSAGAGRAMNRVTVRRHLDSLTALGFVRAVRLVRDGRLLQHFVVDHRQLFALTEELGPLARIHPESEAPPEGTRPAQPAGAPGASGPRLVLVHGARQGQCYPLRPGEGRAWTVGRSPRADVVLDYDPYTSLENTRIQWRGGRFEVRDLPSSRNGTTLNWALLRKGEDHPLASGDVLGVGRSFLVFRE